MEAIYTLVLIVIASALLGYYVLLGLAKLLEKLAKESGGSLKSIFILLTIVGLSYVVVRKDEADIVLDEWIEHVSFWEGDELEYDTPVVRY